MPIDIHLFVQDPQDHDLAIGGRQIPDNEEKLMRRRTSPTRRRCDMEGANRPVQLVSRPRVEAERLRRNPVDSRLQQSLVAAQLLRTELAVRLPQDRADIGFGQSRQAKTQAQPSEMTSSAISAMVLDENSPRSI